MTYETGLYRASDSYRTPDLMAYRPEVASHRGVDGAPELVVEIRSPGDETDDKLPWYLDLGTAEVLVIEREQSTIALHRASGPVEPDTQGWVTLASLGVRLRPMPGGGVVEGPGGPVEVTGSL